MFVFLLTATLSGGVFFLMVSVRLYITSAPFSLGRAMPSSNHCGPRLEQWACCCLWCWLRWAPVARVLLSKRWWSEGWFSLWILEMNFPHAHIVAYISATDFCLGPLIFWWGSVNCEKYLLLSMLKSQISCRAYYILVKHIPQFVISRIISGPSSTPPWLLKTAI